MLTTVLEVIFKAIGYSTIIYALWLLVGESFYNTYVKSGIRQYQNKKRIKRLRELEKEVSHDKKHSHLVEHLEILLTSVSGKGNVNVTNFIMLTIIIFLVTSVILFILLGEPLFSLIIGLLLGASPYLITLYRLEVIRQKTSLAFMNEFHIILQSYQSSSKNIYYTLLNTVQELNDKNMKRQFHKLISSFQKERQDSDFRKHVHIFIYSINSTFSKRFGNLLIKAHLENVDIGKSLSSLNDDITERKKAMEDEATEKLQTVMVGIAPIFVLPITVYFAYQLTGVIDFWYYFTKPTSLALFIVSLLLSIVSVLLALLIRKPKADA